MTKPLNWNDWFRNLMCEERKINNLMKHYFRNYLFRTYIQIHYVFVYFFSSIPRLLDMEFDIVSCQFAFHYCFESLPQAECMLKNISENLKVHLRESQGKGPCTNLQLVVIFRNKLKHTWYLFWIQKMHLSSLKKCIAENGFHPPPPFAKNFNKLWIP